MVIYKEEDIDGIRNASHENTKIVVLLEFQRGFMNKPRTGLKQIVKSAVLVTALAAASNAVATTSISGFPDFHFMDQTLSSASVFSPDFDIFGLGGLDEISATSYTVLFENIGGTALGAFSVFAVDDTFTMPTALDVLGGAFFSGSADSSFSFTSTPGKYHVAVVWGSGDTSPPSYNLHVSAVPEAETWAMILVGLGLIGSMIPRQRVSSIVDV